MSARLLILILALGACSPASAERPALRPALRPSLAETTAPESPPAPPELSSSTAWVSDLLLAGEALWVASDGGVERYRGPDYRERRLYTVADGLDSQEVQRLTLAGTSLVAHTASARCVLTADRFRCLPRRAEVAAPPAVLGSHAGARITSRQPSGAGVLVGTAGAGVWLFEGSEARRLTPTGQLCGNHLTSFAVHGAELWVGTFDDGVCRSRDGRRFEPVAAPFRMVNQLLDTARGLFVAANEGLFHWDETSASFRRVVQVSDKGVSGLALGRGALLATTAGRLWTVPLRPAPYPLGMGASHLRSPGGSWALQGVAVAADGGVWLVSEDRGAIHLDGTEPRVLDRSGGLPTSWMLDVTAAEDGSAYVATLRHGVLRVWPDGRWQSLDGLPDPWIFALHHDEAGLWIGTQRGAALLGRSGVRPLALLPDGRVHAFARFGERMLVGTQHGMASYPVE